MLERALSQVPPQQHAGAIETWLLKLSGLLPQPEASRSTLPRYGFGPSMSGREWRCFRGRPANHPRRRIAGAARLLARFLGPGLVQGLSQRAATQRPRDLNNALAVDAENGGGPAYIGKGRAGDLAVNVVLPLLYACPVARGESQQARDYLALYHRFGRLQDNEVTREMADQLLDPAWGRVVTTARRQQGLLHLHRLLTGAGS